jgi:hypothetical protein
MHVLQILTDLLHILLEIFPSTVVVKTYSYNSVVRTSLAKNSEHVEMLLALKYDRR